jgi:cell division cycle 2-like protein
VSSQQYNNLRQKFSALSEHGLSLLKVLLMYDPMKRATAANALQHAYFKASPRPQAESMMPTFPSSHTPIGQVGQQAKRAKR